MIQSILQGWLKSIFSAPRANSKHTESKGDDIYRFECELLQELSYETSVGNSKLAKDIAEILKGDYQYGAPDFSPYTIAVDLMNGFTGLSAQFDEGWAMVYMMQSLGIIVVEDILNDEHGQVYHTMSVLL